MAEVAVEVATDDAHLENTELVLGEKILALVVRMLCMMMDYMVAVFSQPVARPAE